MARETKDVARETPLGDCATQSLDTLDPALAMSPYGVRDAKHEKWSGGAKDTTRQMPVGSNQDVASGMPHWGTRAAAHKKLPSTVRYGRRETLPEATGEAASKMLPVDLQDAMKETHSGAYENSRARCYPV